MRRALILLAILPDLGMPTASALAQPVPPAVQAAPEPYAALIAEAAQRFAISAAWLRAIMRTESRGDRRAVSRKGALGLMQLMPETWAALRIRYGLGRDPFDPHDNILAGTAFLREMLDRYGSPGFLAAYNAGPRRYEAYRDRHRPLPPETVAYVAALVSFVGGGTIDESAIPTAADPPSWARAPLFIARRTSADAVDSTTPKPSATNNGADVSVRDVSAIEPQARGLFVRVLVGGPKS
ncbi:lytic transglycosylase domain-containing protein [Bradyrhizobium sp. USDA 4473]